MRPDPSNAACIDDLQRVTEVSKINSISCFTFIYAMASSLSGERENFTSGICSASAKYNNPIYWNPSVVHSLQNQQNYGVRALSARVTLISSLQHLKLRDHGVGSDLSLSLIQTHMSCTNSTIFKQKRLITLTGIFFLPEL